VSLLFHQFHGCLNSVSMRAQVSPTDDVRIEQVRALIPPNLLLEELPLDQKSAELILASRQAAEKIVDGEDDRLLVIVGPCSIHDTAAALEYAAKLRQLKDKFADDLLIFMRVYFEKPRTTVGWKGLINDPKLDGSFNINQGLRLGRSLLLDINKLGVPAGVEFLDTITPQYIGDLVSWGAIGARTTESQCHRELASGLSCPIGFKNGTSGNVQIAVDGVKAATFPHRSGIQHWYLYNLSVRRFLGVTKQGIAAIVQTKGNSHCHVILRGGRDGPNYEMEHISAAAKLLDKANLPGRLMVDCSHGNSNKDYTRQPIVAAHIVEQLKAGADSILGVMLESHLKEGRQNLPQDVDHVDNVLDVLEYGKSITDSCISVETTEKVLAWLAEGVRERRQLKRQNKS